MKYISEDRLIQLLKQIPDYDTHDDDKTYWIKDSLLSSLINECRELNQWWPIDKNTPKDRTLLLIYFRYEEYIAVTGYWDGKYYETDIDCLYGETPIFWQELPKLPEPPR